MISLFRMADPDPAVLVGAGFLNYGLKLEVKDQNKIGSESDGSGFS